MNDVLDRMLAEGRRQMESELADYRLRMNILRTENAELRAALATWADADREIAGSHPHAILTEAARDMTRQLLVG